VGQLARALHDLADHRLHLGLVTADVDHLHPGDDQVGQLNTELPVVGRSIPSIPHLHHPRFRIRAGHPRFVLFIRLLGRSGCGHFGQGRFQPGYAFSHRTFLGGPLLGGTLIILCLARFFNFCCPSFSLQEHFLQGGLPSKGGRSSTRTHSHAVLPLRAQVDHSRSSELPHDLGHQLVQLRFMVRAKVTDGMIVQAHATTNPHIGDMRHAQLVDLSGTGHPLTDGIQPQGDQDLRVDSGRSRLSVTDLDMGVKRGQI